MQRRQRDAGPGCTGVFEIRRRKGGGGELYKRRELASFAEGEKKKETMMILAMLRKGFSVESIAECAQTSVEYILELGKKNHLL